MASRPPLIVIESEYRELVADDGLASGLARLADEHFALRSRVTPSSLMGARETAQYLGVARPNLSAMRREGRLPVPVAMLASGPVWRRGDLLVLAEELRGRRTLRTAR